MNKHPYLLLIAALAIGVVFDLLFWGQGYGSNFPLFWTAFLGAGVLLLIKNDIKLHPSNISLLLLFLFFSLMSIIRAEPLSRFLAITGMLFCLFTIAHTFTNGRWVEMDLGKYVAGFFLLMAGILYLPINFFNDVRKERKEQNELDGKSTASIVGRILIGIVISIPIVIIFLSLLASADSVFKEALSNFFNHLGDAVLHVMWVLVIAYTAAGIYIYSGNVNKKSSTPVDSNVPKKANTFLGIIESSIILGSISAVFLIFVFIQFKYFFGGNVNIGGGGFTYSEYARRGFSELNWVAFLSLFIVVVLSLITHRDTDKQRLIFTGLNLLVIVQVVIILVSAFQRLLLAIDWHGLSRLRVYPLLFMIWLGALLICVAVLEMRQREKYFTFAIIVAAIGYAASICIINVDGNISTYNAARTLDGKHFNATHLATLSLDAIPALVSEFENNALPDEIHEGLGAALVCQKDRLEKWGDEKDWRSLDLSYSLAKNSLETVESDLNHFEFLKNEAGNYVKTPGGFKHQCSDYYIEDRED